MAEQVIISTPRFKTSKTEKPSLEIKMWEIQGEYADGNWHLLIHEFVKTWNAEHNFENVATIWSTTYYDSFLIVTCGLPSSFLKQLQSFLETKLRGNVRLSGDVIIDGSWRPYLHLEQGKIWEFCDYNQWSELG